MPKLNYKSLVSLHVLISTLFLPVALMLFISGSLYTWEIKGSYDSNEFLIDVEKPLKQDADFLKSIVLKYLNSNQIPHPSGWHGIVKDETTYYFEWRGVDHKITLEPTELVNVAKLNVHETTFFKKMVLLHKAEGSFLFKFYTTLFAALFPFLLVTGLLLSWRNKNLRKIMLLSLSSGTIIFLLLFSIQK